MMVIKNNFVFQPRYRCFERIKDTDYILSWKSTGLCSESIRSPFAPNNSLNPSLDYLVLK